MRVSLHAADLHYHGGLVLHTASSGSVPFLRELFLYLDDGDVAGCGETRLNIAYLNGLSEQQVTADAVAAITGADWSRDPADLLAEMDGWAARYTAPVRMLIDGALHDIVARRAGRSVADWLGAPASSAVRSPSNQTLFWSSHSSFIQRADAYVQRGFRDLKVRIAAGRMEDDLHRVASLRDRFGDTIKIAADANGQWTAADAPDRLNALSAYGLSYIEQPIPPGDWDAIGRLAETSPIPIMLDEGLGSAADVARVCEFGGRVLAHLKLVKLGGIAPTMAAARRLSAAGVPFMIGQMNEGGVATAAALHTACASAPAYRELYGADGLADDPASGLTYADGAVSVGASSGLGITFDATRTQLIQEF